MKNLSLAVPSLGSFAPAAAPPFDIRTLDASNILLKLSMDLQTTDTITIFGTLDVTATSLSPNLNLLGTVSGNNGQAISGEFVSFWPYLYIQRTAGTTPTSPTSLFFACSATAFGTPSAPLTTALPPTTFFSTLINLAPFGNPVRVGLDGNQTEIDTFNLYGTDDPTTIGFAGGTLLANLQGGGGQGSNSLVSAFQYVYVLRTGGFTAGNLIAWSADDPGAGGGGVTPPINLGSLAVNNTAVNGNFGTPPLTAPMSVDIFSSFVLTQTSIDIFATLPTPTVLTAGKIVFVSNSAASVAPIFMYGLSIGIGYGASFQRDGTEWTPVGVGNAFTDGGNLFGHTATLATLDNHNLIIAAGGPVPTTGNVVINANGQVFITSNHSIGLAPDITIISNGSGPGAGVFIEAVVGSISLDANQAVIISATMVGTGNVQVFADLGGIGLNTNNNGPISLITNGSGDITLQPGVTGNVNLRSGGVSGAALRFFDAGNLHFLSFQAPSVLPAFNTSWILPPQDASFYTLGLTSDSAGNLSFNAGTVLLAYASGGQSIPDAAIQTPVVYGLVSEQIGASYNPVTGVFTCPVAGFYYISAGVEFLATAAALHAEFTITVYQGINSIAEGVEYNPVAALSNLRNPRVNVGSLANVGDTFRIQVSQNSGIGPIALTATEIRNFLSIHFV